jgi:hypothetical protein
MSTAHRKKRRLAPVPSLAISLLLLCGVQLSGPSPDLAQAAKQHRKCSPAKRHRRPQRRCPGRHAARGSESSKPGARQVAAATEPTAGAAEPIVPGTSTAPLGPSGGSGAEPVPALGKVPGQPFRFFSPTGPWNSAVAPEAALDPDSARLVGDLNREVQREVLAQNGPWINTTSYSIPLYEVGAEQPTVSVRLSSPYSAAALRSSWSAVPLPPDAQPALGTDGHLAVWQPSSDRLWEFWRLSRGSEGWQAPWGGTMRNVSSNPGVYGADAWPGAEPTWGASASSLSIVGGLITLEDLEHGEIDHALALSLPEVRRGFFAAPALRTDGTSIDPLSLPEGAHLRLDPALDLAELNLPPLTLMIAEAAQRYGLFVRDKARTVCFSAQPPNGPVNPYAGRSGYFEGKTPGRLLASFPWEHLQVLRLDLHSSSAARST